MVRWPVVDENLTLASHLLPICKMCKELLRNTIMGQDCNPIVMWSPCAGNALDPPIIGKFLINVSLSLSAVLSVTGQGVALTDLESLHDCQ